MRRLPSLLSFSLPYAKGRVLQKDLHQMRSSGEGRFGGGVGRAEAVEAAEEELIWCACTSIPAVAGSEEAQPAITLHCHGRCTRKTLIRVVLLLLMAMLPLMAMVPLVFLLELPDSSGTAVGSGSSSVTFTMMLVLGGLGSFLSLLVVGGILPAMQHQLQGPQLSSAEAVERARPSTGARRASSADQKGVPARRAPRHCRRSRRSSRSGGS